ncbi:MAG: cysteine synthase A [Clostridiales bacterium]|nr:cysteine synthase A [Clostridiales bacterium]
MANIYTSVDQLIGNTPLMRLCNLEKALGLNARLLAKLEFFNPGGSVKDRVAKTMIDEAESRGILTSDSVIIEPTSGNTGIGLACVAASRGYRAIIVMPETMSLERRLLMKAYGAELILTEGSLGMPGAIKKAEELAREIPGAFIPGQFTNPANPLAHFNTTGPEIWKDTDGNIDFFVAGIGTGGTITGTGRYLKSQRSNIQVIGIEPASSAFLTTGKAGAHKLQGIGAGFVPEVLDLSICDAIVPVTDEDAFRAVKDISRYEGILTGISAGAAMHAAIELARKPENAEKTIVTLFPDTGDRYLTVPEFTD